MPACILDVIPDGFTVLADMNGEIAAIGVYGADRPGASWSPMPRRCWHIQAAANRHRVCQETTERATQARRTFRGMRRGCWAPTDAGQLEYS